jgi:hypothetical protein
VRLLVRVHVVPQSEPSSSFAILLVPPLHLQRVLCERSLSFIFSFFLFFGIVGVCFLVWSIVLGKVEKLEFAVFTRFYGDFVFFFKKLLLFCLMLQPGRR